MPRSFHGLTLADVDISAVARDDGDGRGPGAFGRDAAGGEPRESPVQMFLRTGLAASAAPAVDPDDLARLVAVAERRVASAEKALHANHPDIRVGDDVFAFREMGSRGGRRFDLLFPKPEWDVDETTEARTDAAFVRDFATRAPWVPTLVEPVLGKNDGKNDDDDDDDKRCVDRKGPRDASSPEPPRRHRSNAWWCDVSVVYSKPGAPAQDWHCDGRHLAGEARADYAGAGAAPPYAVCVFCPLIDLGEDVGFTRFWAGSHVADGLIGFGAAAEVCVGFTGRQERRIRRVRTGRCIGGWVTSRAAGRRGRCCSFCTRGVTTGRRRTTARARCFAPRRDAAGGG